MAGKLKLVDRPMAGKLKLVDRPMTGKLKLVDRPVARRLKSGDCSIVPVGKLKIYRLSDESREQPIFLF